MAIPAWVKQGINAWMSAAGIEDGRLLRAVSKGGKVKESMSGWAVWSVVEQSAREIGIERFGAQHVGRILKIAAVEPEREWTHRRQGGICRTPGVIRREHDCDGAIMMLKEPSQYS